MSYPYWTAGIYYLWNEGVFIPRLRWEFPDSYEPERFVMYCDATE